MSVIQYQFFLLTNCLFYQDISDRPTERTAHNNTAHKNFIFWFQSVNFSSLLDVKYFYKMIHDRYTFGIAYGYCKEYGNLEYGYCKGFWFFKYSKFHIFREKILSSRYFKAKHHILLSQVDVEDILQGMCDFNGILREIPSQPLLFRHSHFCIKYELAHHLAGILFVENYPHFWSSENATNPDNIIRTVCVKLIHSVRRRK